MHLKYMKSFKIKNDIIEKEGYSAKITVSILLF